MILPRADPSLPVTREFAGARQPSTLKVRGAKKILQGELSEEQYVQGLARELLGQSADFYKLMGGQGSWTDRLGSVSATVSVLKDPSIPISVKNQLRNKVYKAYLLAERLRTPVVAEQFGTQAITRLPPRMFSYSGRDPELKGQLYSAPFFPRPGAQVMEVLAATPKTGPLELIKLGRIPFLDIDTPSTGRFREVHPKEGITAASKAEALDVLQRISNQLGSTLRAYVSPGGLRAFDVSRERNPMDFYRAVGKKLSAKLDPHYMQGSTREGWFTPIGSAVRRWDPKTGQYYPFSLENVYKYPGFNVRTGPKFNREPLDDYIATSIGNITPQGQSGPINPAMLETVLQMHDARISANRTPQSATAMRGDLLELISQGVKGSTLEFIKKNYKLLAALGLIPAATLPTTNDNRTA